SPRKRLAYLPIPASVLGKSVYRTSDLAESPLRCTFPVTRLYGQVERSFVVPHLPKPDETAARTRMEIKIKNSCYSQLERGQIYSNMSDEGGCAPKRQPKELH